MILIFAAGNLTAQDFKGGVVKYQQTIKYDFKAIFGKFKDHKANEWVASLPTESRGVKVLYFTSGKGLYEDDPADKEAMPKKLQVALMKASYFKPPSPELKKVYYDFGKNEKIIQVEFMTRNFLVSDSIERVAWKLTNKKVKILDFICFGAELKKDDDLIFAWFTSEIPVSAGPDEFFGLPGLILALEINGETVFMATSIDLKTPIKDVLSEPGKGKKVTKVEFDKIMEEKIKEFKETKKSGIKKRKNIIRNNRRLKTQNGNIESN